MEIVAGGLKYPAYFLVLGLGYLVKESQDSEGSWFYFFGFALLVVLIVSAREVFTKRNSGYFDALGTKARDAFLAGPSAESLTGRWRVLWFKGEGNQREVYDVEPEGFVEIKTHRSCVFCTSDDKASKFTYWLEGRLSIDKMLALNYWSDPDIAVAGLVGVVLLRYESDRVNGKPTLRGTWRGRTGDGKVTVGETEWTKLD